jgi:hypothetical protein
MADLEAEAQGEEVNEHLFDIDEEAPEVPILRAPVRRKSEGDGRFRGEYPPDWKACQTCGGLGALGALVPDGTVYDPRQMYAPPRKDERVINARWQVAHAPQDQWKCPDCLGLGSVKARVRFQAGFRCLRCRHPYVPKGDADMLGVEPSGIHDCETCEGSGTVAVVMKGRNVGITWMMLKDAERRECEDCHGAGKLWLPWSVCDKECVHSGPIRIWVPCEGSPKDDGWWETEALRPVGELIGESDQTYEAAWRILTVHHLDGDKGNLRWWNLAALCQRCHLEIQAKVMMDRVYPFEHSDWFKPFVAGYYAWVYLGEELDRDQAEARMDELLALERMA